VELVVGTLQRGPGSRSPRPHSSDASGSRRRRRAMKAMLRQVEKAGGIFIGGFPDRLLPDAERRLELVRRDGKRSVRRSAG
jgi:hypothetical protein